MRGLRSVSVPALAIAALLAAGCAEPVGPGDASDYPLVLEPVVGAIGEQERLAYEEDAVRLAIRHLVAIGSGSSDDVNPPAALVSSLYNALLHVYATSHPARDAVVAEHRIHTFPMPATREIMVRVDPAHAWTEAWRELRAETGNPAVDALVVDHALTVRNFYEWSTGDVAVLRAASPLNAAALAARFASLAGVIWAEQNGAVGDGNDIRARRHDSGWRLDYSVGSGDCPAGCISRYTWSFSVSAAGLVQFLGSGQL